MLYFRKLFFKLDLFICGKAIAYEYSVCTLAEVFQKDVLALVRGVEPSGAYYPADISGMYYEWKNVEEISIGGCPGTIGQAQDGDRFVELCQWYGDAKQYSLSVFTAELDGLDLTAVAEQICNQ